jgi:uncharacterized membrane protein
MKTALDVLHVLTAVFLIGPMAVLPMTSMRLLRDGAHGQVGTLAKSTNIFSLASLLVVIFGFGVMGMSDAKYDLSITTPWILISLIAYLVALGLNLAVVVPAMQKAAGQTSEASGSGSYSRIAMGSGVVSLLLILVVVLMVAKP